MVDAVPLPSTAASADLILDKVLVAAEGRACPSLLECGEDADVIAK